MLEAEVPGGILLASADTVANGGTVTLTFDGGANSAGQNVGWRIVSGPGSLASAATTTDSFGVSTNTLTGNSTGSGHIVARATVNGKAYEVTVTLEGAYGLVFASVSGGGNFVSGASATADITVALQQNGLAYTASAVTVTWSILSSDNSGNPAVTEGFKKRAAGLNWGGTAIDPASAGNELSTTATSNTSTRNGQASVQLTDILGERIVKVQARVTIDGVDYTALQDVPFGKGPISVFKAPEGTSKQWSGDNAITGSTTSFPAAEYCRGRVTAGSPDFYAHSSWERIGGGYYYAKDSKLPKEGHLSAVSYSGNGAWAAAGWSGGNYWTGEVLASGQFSLLEYRGGTELVKSVNSHSPVVCLR